jgi:predicted  nucleic acid-binding Zn-ribbon protein
MKKYVLIDNKKDYYNVLHPDGTIMRIAKKHLSADMKKNIELMGAQNNQGSHATGSMPVKEYANTPQTYPEGMAAVDNSLNYLKTNAGIPNNAIPSAPNSVYQMDNNEYVSGITPNQENLTPEALLSAENYNPNARFTTQTGQGGTFLPQNTSTQNTPINAPAPVQNNQDNIQTLQTSAESAPQNMNFNRLSMTAPSVGMSDRSVRMSQQAANDLERNLAAREARMMKEEGDFTNYMNAQNASIDEVVKKEIDPKRFWKNKTTGEKVIASIATLISGLGSAAGGGENLATKNIQSAIDQDIQIQKGQKDSLYNSILQKTKNREVAQEITQKALLNSAQMQIQLTAAKTNNAEVVQRFDATRAQLAQEQAKLNQSINEKMAGDYLLKMAGEGKDLGIYKEKLHPNQLARLVDTQGFANDPQGAQKARKSVEDYNVMNRLVDRLREIHADPMAQYSPALKEEADGISERLVGRTKESIIGTGPMSETEYPRVKVTVPTGVADISSWDAKTLHKLDTFQQQIKENHRELLKSQGVTPKGLD